MNDRSTVWLDQRDFRLIDYLGGNNGYPKKGRRMVNLKF